MRDFLAVIKQLAIDILAGLGGMQIIWVLLHSVPGSWHMDDETFVAASMVMPLVFAVAFVYLVLGQTVIHVADAVAKRASRAVK